MNRPSPTLVGDVSRVLAADDHPAEVVATISVNRHLRSGVLDPVRLTEHDLAVLVAEGAAVLASMARERAR